MCGRPPGSSPCNLLRIRGRGGRVAAAAGPTWLSTALEGRDRGRSRRLRRLGLGRAAGCRGSPWRSPIPPRRGPARRRPWPCNLSAIHPRCATALVGDVAYGLVPVVPSAGGRGGAGRAGRGAAGGADRDRLPRPGRWTASRPVIGDRAGGVRRRRPALPRGPAPTGPVAAAVRPTTPSTGRTWSKDAGAPGWTPSATSRAAVGGDVSLHPKHLPLTGCGGSPRSAGLT